MKEATRKIPSRPAYRKASRFRADPEIIDRVRMHMQPRLPRFSVLTEGRE